MEPEALAAFIAQIKDLPVDKMVKLFVKTREAKSLATKAHDALDTEYKSIMEACENHMLAKADAAGVTGFTTPYGTTYSAETKKISIANDEAFFEFVLAQKELGFFERRVSSTMVDNYMKDNDGTAPPGLTIFREKTMRVRKAADK